MFTGSEGRITTSFRVVVATAFGLVLALGSITPAIAAEAPGVRPLKLVVAPRKATPAFTVGARPVDATDAARFLAQATFGPASIEEVERLWDPLESTCRHASLSIL